MSFSNQCSYEAERLRVNATPGALNSSGAPKTIVDGQGRGGNKTPRRTKSRASCHAEGKVRKDYEKQKSIETANTGADAVGKKKRAYLLETG